MNMKQSLREASKHIKELEDWNRRAKIDIMAYNACIDGVIAGNCSYCDWCEENRLGECDKPEHGTGCAEWWLMDNPIVKIPEEADADGREETDGKGILPASETSGE